MSGQETLEVFVLVIIFIFGIVDEIVVITCDIIAPERVLFKYGVWRRVSDVHDVHDRESSIGVVTLEAISDTIVRFVFVRFVVQGKLLKSRLKASSSERSLST